MADAGLMGGVERGAIAGTATTGAAPRWTCEDVRAVRRWTDNLLSFTIGRPAAYRFTPGHYARLGLGDDPGGIEWRPFSIVSAAADDVLEFFAVLVPDGAFSQRLARVRPGDPIRIEKASYGFLTVGQLAAGRDLWLLASGSGLGPFVSILRDATTWQAFDRIILAHSVRLASELAYREEIAGLAAEATATNRRARLRYIPVVTREPCPGALSARLPQLLEDGSLQAAAGTALGKEGSRVMVCGNPELVRALRAWLSARGFEVGRRGVPGQMAFEKYW